MKRFVLFFFILIFFFISTNAAVITWTGAANTNWNNTANWLPNTAVPGSNDDVVFNSSAIVTMDILTSSAPYVINSLRITNGANVEFQISLSGNRTRILQVKSVDAITKGLKIDGGCVLLIHGINLGAGTIHYILDLCGAAGVTGEISGELDFSGVGSTDTRDSTRLRVVNGANYANLVVKSGGVIKYLDLSGNTTSAVGSYLTMENNSIYEIAKDNGFFPQATWQPNSIAKASSPGITVPGFVDGMTYGNLEWNCPFQDTSSVNANTTFNNVTFISTNGKAFRIKSSNPVSSDSMTINGNLDINSGSFVEIVGNSASLGSLGKIILKGHLNNLGTLTTNGTTGTSSKFELHGSTNQNITGQLGGVTLELIMNGDSATLMNSLFLLGNNNAAGPNLQLIKGKIITTSSTLLIMPVNSTVSGGSDSSFVSGPMRKTGNNNFIFPVGKGSMYAPIGITNVSGEAPTDVFVAEYIRANPQSIYGPLVDPSPSSRLNHVSFVEYWTLTRTGSAFKKVSLAVNVTSFCTNLDSTFVGQWNGSVWTNQESTVVNGPTYGINQTGTIRSRNNINFTPTNSVFTLATSLPFASNPLPIDLISFDASKISNTKASLNWELASVCSPAAKFEIQRASSDKHFSTIAVVNGSATGRIYSSIDNGLKNGINYHRLKMIDEDGTISYSRTVVVMNGTTGLILTSLIPTVVNSAAQLTIASSSRQQLDLNIIDMQGRVVQKQNQTVMAGNTSIQLKTDRLSAGIYQLVGITPEGKTNMIRFIKQ